jgi:hypothetical protein
MVSQRAPASLSARRDGFGTRLIEPAPAGGLVERLVLSPALATPGSEQAIRARAAHLNSLAPGPIGRVLRIERKGTELSVLSDIPDGVTLSDVLAALEFGTLTLSDDELLELAASIVQAAGTMHGILGSLAHGTMSSAHVVVTLDGSAVFTNAVFGDAVQLLKCNREHLWRAFELVLPASASVPRFDQRADVVQLGALILAIAQRRSLRRDECPRALGDLVMASSIGSSPQLTARLRTWLQDTLQLHGRVVFDSCVDAAGKFARVLPTGCGDETGALVLRTAIRQLCGGAVSSGSADSEWRPRSAPELSHQSVA